MDYWIGFLCYELDQNSPCPDLFLIKIPVVTLIHAQSPQLMTYVLSFKHKYYECS